MKKTATLFLALLLLAATHAARAQGQSDGRNPDSWAATVDLGDLVSAINATCPNSMGSIGQIVRCHITSTHVVMECEINEPTIDLDALKSHPDAVRNNLNTVVENASGFMDTVFRVIAAQNKGYSINYTGKTSGKQLTMSLSSDEIKSILKRRENSDPLQTLQSQLSITNLQMPMTAGDGLVVNKVYIEGEYVIYNCITDETLYSIDELAEVFDGMDAEVTEYFDLGDRSVFILLRQCVDANKGIAYRYQGNKSGKSCMLTFSASKIKEALRNDD